MPWAVFVVVELFWQGDKNLSGEISWILSIENQCKHFEKRKRFGCGYFNDSGKFESWKT